MTKTEQRLIEAGYQNVATLEGGLKGGEELYHRAFGTKYTYKFLNYGRRPESVLGDAKYITARSLDSGNWSWDPSFKWYVKRKVGSISLTTGKRITVK